jgi:hypothetical protein
MVNPLEAELETFCPYRMSVRVIVFRGENGAGFGEGSGGGMQAGRQISEWRGIRFCGGVGVD